MNNEKKNQNGKTSMKYKLYKKWRKKPKYLEIRTLLTWVMKKNGKVSMKYSPNLNSRKKCIKFFLISMTEKKTHPLPGRLASLGTMGPELSPHKALYAI